VGEALVNPERLRRALGRRNEATHPVEVPTPLDELRRAAAVLRISLPEALARSGGAPWNEGDPCQLCDEPDGDPDDPVAHWLSPVVNRQRAVIMAHASCGESHELELA
jgi:hypothetical protein